MQRHNRTKSGFRKQSSELSREDLQPFSRKSNKHGNLREEPLLSPTSPKLRKNANKDAFAEPRPTTPEEWIAFAQMKIRQTTGAILILANLEPDLLEFLITADEEIRDTVQDWACRSSFPVTRDGWKTSPSRALLERFQIYLNRLPPELVNRKVDETSRKATLFLAVLAALDHVMFETKHEEEPEEGEADPFFKVKVKKSQKKRKAAAGNLTRARQNTVVIDPKVFAAADFEFPTCLEQVLDIEYALLSRLREGLKVLFTAFENPELAVHAKALFFKQPLQFVPSKATTTNTTEAATDNPTNGPDMSAFPHIRPLAAAKYFDETSALGAWPVIVSGRAVSDLRQMQKRDSHVFAMVHKKITELSQGFFSDSNQKKLQGLDTEVPIYEAKVSRDLRIVYQIDLDTDVDAKIDKQIIKLYGVYTHAQLDNRMWALVSHYHIHRRGKEYRRRCLFRATHRAPGQNVTLPAQFKHEEDMEMPVEASPTETPSLDGMTEKDFLNLHSLIALEKFIPMSQSLINSILNDSDASHVFHVSAKEKEIIYYDSACFVLGRSGTGKTTSILFKMIGIEKLFERMEEMAKPRQVFVTQSRVLAQRVQEYYQNLVKSSSENLDKTSKPVEDEEHVLADLDDEEASAFGLPPKYSMLEDHHFPLFLTFDQLCSLLEADFGLQSRRSTRTKAQAATEKRFAIAEVADVKIDLDREVEAETTDAVMSPSTGTKDEILHAKLAAVTFEIFVAAYWAHFDFRLTKGFDPALVYSEFLGVIEGSEAALASETGALTREEYTGLSHRKSSFASQRDRVYDLYEIYRKRKQQLGGYDAAERTHALVSALNNGVPGSKFDCLYIDEAQDNLLVDIKLLHTLSNNPHGIFIAGDTAQTISAGSAFRFEDLKAFMWRLEEQDEAVRVGKRNAVHPALFHLAVNYRSHGGIVDCASSVVQLISDLFPYSIDKLSKETGLIDGPKPIFFSGWDHGVVRFEQFLRGEADTKIDFGASQVILVRNEAARSALRAQVGEIGLILTLYESKGLEFDDVLLYNFFEDSVPTASTWRVILHGLQGTNLGPAPRFDEIRHAVICTELKNLYVGLTRARNHCWIWDVSDKAEPMKWFWSQKSLINLCGPNDPMPQLSVSSSEADWAKSGRLLFNKGLYPQAMFCFEKADLLVERDIAGAYQARKEARILLAKSADRQTRRTAFRKAAGDFLGCATLSKGKQQTSCYLRAAECYLQAEDWKSAAESYFSADQFDLAAKNFRRAGCFEEAVDIVKKYRQRLTSQSLVDEILAIARLQFLRKSEYQKASALFDSVDEQLEYMEDFGFNAARLHVLELHKRFADAAAVALQEQNVLEGVRLLLLSTENKHKLQAVKHAVHGLWTLLPYGSSIAPNNHGTIGSLLERISAIDSQLIDDVAQRQIDLFRTLQEKNADRILTLARSNALLSRASEALLAFAHSSRSLIPPQNTNLDNFNSKSMLALSYYNGLSQLIRNFQTSSPETQRLLGFEPVKPETASEDEGEDQDQGNAEASEFRVYSSSCLFEPLKRVLGNQEPTALALGLAAITAPESDLHRLVVSTLTTRLKLEVTAMNSTATAVRGLRSCLEFGIFGNCRRAGCGRQEVSGIRLSDPDRQKHFNLRLRSHILQILIIQAYPPQNPEDQKVRDRNIRIWMEKVYETLFPHFPPLGNVLCADPKLVQEVHRAGDTLSRWCENRLYSLNPSIYATRASFLTEVIVSLELGCRIKRQTFEGYAAKLHSCPLTRDEAALVPAGSKSSIVHNLIDYYAGQTETTLQGVLTAAQHIVKRFLSIEINVLVHFLESIGRDVIMQTRAVYFAGASNVREPQEWARARSKAVDGLILPRSWALDIVRNPPKRVQAGWDVTSYMTMLYDVLSRLKYDDLDNTTFYAFDMREMGVLFRGVMILRICRLIILVAENIVYNYSEKDKVRSAISNALTITGQGSIHERMCKSFVRTTSWKNLQSALIESPLNNSADELVRLSLRNSHYRPPNIPGVRRIIYETILPGLEADLTFVAQNTSRGPVLNPEAKPFVLGQKNVDDAPTNTDNDNDNNEELADSEQGQVTDDPFGGLVPAQLTFKIPVAPTTTVHTLTEEERIAGAKILLFCERYILRRQARARHAIRVIWKYCLRYHRRRQSSSGNTEGIRKLHEEYKQTIGEIECPLLLDKALRMHQMILQGPMPHVCSFLRGLEKVNQRQKENTKRKLQRVQHEELEKVQARMTTCNALNKRIKKMIPQLQPGSPALRKLSSLKSQVSEVESLRWEVIEAFGDGCISANLESHYSLGVQVILTPSQEPTAPKPLRPEINTLDIEDML